MNKSYPCIKVCDIETTIDWYVDFLGFQCVYKSSIKHPDFALLEKEQQKVYLLKNDNRESYASNIIIFETSELEAEYDAVENRGVIVVQPIQEGMFGGNEFVIKDYEDNKIIYRQNKI